MKMNFRLSGIGAALGLLLGMQALGTFAADAMTIDGSGQVGIGTETPGSKLHVKDGNLTVEQTGAGTHAVLNFATAASSWEIKQNGNTGRLTFFSPGGGASTASFKFAPQAQENLFRVGILGGDTVDINGKLVINGTDVTPDYVFEPGYPLESIEEHAALMWESKHLPALSGATANEEGVDIVRHQYGTLEELEKAHIYISQLNEAIKELQIEQDKRMIQLKAENMDLKSVLAEQDERMIQLEMALAEVLRHQSSGFQVGSAN